MWTYLSRVFLKQTFKYINDELAFSTFIWVAHFMWLQWRKPWSIAMDDISQTVTAVWQHQTRTETKSTATRIWVLVTTPFTMYSNSRKPSSSNCASIRYTYTDILNDVHIQLQTDLDNPLSVSWWCDFSSYLFPTSDTVLIQLNCSDQTADLNVKQDICTLCQHVLLSCRYKSQFSELFIRHYTKRDS